MMQERLDSLTKDEWRDVYRLFKPEASEQDYELDWLEFQRFKEDLANRLKTV